MADDLNINIGANPAGVEAGSRRAKVALKGVADGGKDLDAALRRLRSSIDPTFVAMEKYNKVHAENLTLLRAGLVSRREYNQAMKAAKTALEEESAALQRNSAAGRAAIAAQRQAKAQALAESRAASMEEQRIARETAAAARAAAREAAAEAKRLKAEERAATREAAAAAKAAAREEAAVIRQAKREEAEAAREASRTAQAEAREKSRVEKAEARAIAEADKQARREQREAAREASRVAAAAAKEAAAAKRDEARASKEAASTARDQARAERETANAVRELRGSVDPAFAAQERYNETMRRATQLLMQNKLQQGEFTKVQRQARAQMDLNVRSLGRQNSMYVQLGYQAQDVTASLASGINPLVILAQQGGQTAAALATMGGKAGSVAAFFAGPWGAAIIGATMLLGYLWDSMSEGEKATKDLMNAEDRRAMSVKELTSAIREYSKAQREANELALEGARKQVIETARAQGEITTRIAETRAELEKYQAILDRFKNNPGLALVPGAAGLLAAAGIKVAMLTKQLKSLEQGAKDAAEAATEATIGYADELATTTEVEKEHQAAVQGIQEWYRKSGQSAADSALLVKKLADEEARYTKAKKDESDARRENERAAKDEAKAVWASREAAIGTAGKELRKGGAIVNGNNQFGRTTGHANDADHNRYAIDVNLPGYGPNNPEASNEAARRKMDDIAKSYQARGFRVLWNGKVYAPFGAGPTADIVVRAGAKGDTMHRSHAHIYAGEEVKGAPSGSKISDQVLAEAERVAAEERRIAEEALRDKVAEYQFEQELAQDNLAAVIAIQDEKIAALTAFYGATSREVMDAGRERIRMERAQTRELLEIARSELDQRLQLAELNAEVANAQAGAGLDREGAAVDFAAANGIINAEAALAQKAAILDREFSQQVAHENRMFQLKTDNIRSQLALENLPAKVRRELNEELERAEAEHLARMSGLQQAYATDVQRVYTDSASLTLAKWRDIATTLSGSMTSAFQGIWTHQQTLQEGLINAADQMVYKFVDAGAKMFEEWFMRQVGMTAVTTAQEGARTAATAASQTAQTGAVVAGTAAQTGAKVAAATTEMGVKAATTAAAVTAEGVKTGAAIAGAATQTSVGAAAGMAEIGTRAATSAAGAFSSTVVIPFIGPVAAPVAAAAALAAVLGFGALISARGGQGEVPEDGQLSVLHKKEMVLPAQYANPLRQMLVSPRASAGLMGAASAAGTTTREAAAQTNSAINFHYQPKHTNMGAGFDELLRKDGRALRKWIKNEVRNGGLTLK